MTSTVAAILRLNQSVGFSDLIQCDGYTVLHRYNIVTLSFPRNEQGLNDTFILNKIRALAKIYYDQYGSSDSGKFVELFDDLTNYNYYLKNDEEQDVEEMLDYLEQQQDEDDILQQQQDEQQDDDDDILQQQQDEQKEDEDNFDFDIATNYVNTMEYLYGANIDIEKDWLIHNEIKSAFPYLTTLHVIRSTLDNNNADYFFDPIANIFTIYLDNSQHFQIIVRYATPFYSIVRFRHFNIPENNINEYETQLNMFREKLVFQCIVNTN